MKHLLPLCLCLLLAACGSDNHVANSAGTAPAAKSKDVTITAADGTSLNATVFAPEHPKAGVVCLPMYRATRETFNPIADPLVQQGFLLLALDPRGFGKSGSDAQRKDVANRKSAVFEAMTQDVEAAFKALHEDFGLADDAPTALIGASVGGTVAVLYAAAHPGLKALVLLSPGDYMGVKASGVAGGIKAKVLLTTEDAKTAAPIRAALEKAGNAPEYYTHAVADESVPINDHATNQFGKNYGVEDKLVSFLNAAVGD